MPGGADSRPPESEHHPAGLDDRWTVPGVCIILTAFVFVVFGQTYRFQFVNYDDDHHVYANPAVTGGLTFAGIAKVFRHSNNDYWHPLDFVSHMIDCQLFGLNPAGHHLTNVLLHAVTAILLFLVLRQMTGALWRSAFVAAVFAIHPLRVESVAWVSERKDMLSGMFCMLTIWAYVRYARGPWSPARYGLVLLLFALGLMSKPTLMALPFLLLLLDYWPLGRFAGEKTSSAILTRLVVEKIPLLILSFCSCLEAFTGNSRAFTASGNISHGLQIANALSSYMVYLQQTFWPANLAVLYPFPGNGVPFGRLCSALVLLVLISSGVFLARKKYPYLLVGWFWYLGMLVPMIGFVQAGAYAHADRYTYLPQIGLCLLVAWAAKDLASTWRYGRQVLVGATVALVVTLAVCSWRQTSYWRDSETLWRHTLACTSDNLIAHNNLGLALLQKGAVDEAISHFQKALQINPDDAKTRNNLGNALLKKGAVDEAIVYYQKALQINPDDAEAHYNLGLALFQKGAVDEAISHFQEALEINPGYAEADNNLGGALLQKGSVDEAITHFQKALQINPDYAEAHYNLGNALFRKGGMDEAISHFQKALQINPDYAEAHNNLGLALLQKGSVDEAIAHFQRALEIRPDHVGTLVNLAWVLATCPQASLRNGNKAVELAQRANQFVGDGNPAVLGTLAAAYAEAGRFPKAVETAQRALQVAETQSNNALAETIRSQLKLYQAGIPFHLH